MGKDFFTKKDLNKTAFKEGLGYERKKELLGVLGDKKKVGKYDLKRSLERDKRFSYKDRQGLWGSLSGGAKPKQSPASVPTSSSSTGAGSSKRTSLFGAIFGKKSGQTTQPSSGSRGTSRNEAQLREQFGGNRVGFTGDRESSSSKSSGSSRSLFGTRLKD